MLNMMSLGAGGGAGLSCGLSPMCMLVGSHATQPTRWVGYENREGATPYGEQRPTQFLGLEVRLHNFDTTNGACYIRFGDDEETQIPNVYQIEMNYGTDDGVTYLHTVVYDWNSTEGRYEVIDQTLCDYMATQVGEVVGFADANPYIAFMRVRVVGRISSFTRAGDFELITDAVPLVFETDFHRWSESNINFNDGEMDLFMQGVNNNTDVVSNNQNGDMNIVFTPNSIRKLDELTISGRPSAESTQFRFTIYDSNGEELFNSGLNVVTDKETIPINIDIT